MGRDIAAGAGSRRSTSSRYQCRSATSTAASLPDRHRRPRDLLPGFGFSSAPEPDRFEYTFASLSKAIEGFVERLELSSFFVYLHDFGAPVGYELALAAPERVLGIIVQNGNSHDSGMGPQWDSTREFWADPTPERRAALPEWLNLEGMRYQYVGGAVRSPGTPPGARELAPRLGAD